MKVSCGHCGEELMGRVNRCWNCGHAFNNAATPVDQPSIVRPPVELHVAEHSSPDNIPTAELVETTSPVPRENKRGNPVNPTSNPFQPTVTANYPTGALQRSFAIASIIASVVAIFSSIITMWAVLPAVLAIVFAFYSRSRNHRRHSMLAIAIACIAFSACALRTIFEVRSYQQRQIDYSSPFF